jgi:hypothetical protein
MQIHAKEMSINPKGGIPVEIDYARRVAEMEQAKQEWDYIRQMGYELASRSINGMPLLSEEEVALLIQQEKDHLYEEAME